MEFVGQPLTDEERERVKNPYQKNSGSNWTLEETTRLIVKGHKALESEKEQLKKLSETYEKI